MRDYIFRAKTIEDIPKWIKGYLVKDHTSENVYIFPQFGYDKPVLVNSDTVGMYIGKKDKKNREIFEGDIVHHYNGAHEVYFDESSYSFQMDMSPYESDQCGACDEKDVEIIGNIFDNKKIEEVKPKEEQVNLTETTPEE